MQRQSAMTRAAKIGIVLTITLVTAAVFPDIPRRAVAHAPTPFLASPYYGPPGDGVSQRWIAGSHNGIDFLLRYAPVLAAAGGTLDVSAWNDPLCHNDNWPGCGATAGGLGLYVRINHGPADHPYYTYYGHLSVARSTGTVSKGRWIGTSGDTGYSTGPHLHFEVRHGGTTPAHAVNPDNESGVSLWTDGEWTGSNPAVSVPTRRFATLNAYGAATIVDDTPDNTGGFTKGRGWSGTQVTCPPNTCTAWTRVLTGNAGDMYYTGVWGNTADYWARWQPNLPQTGLYEVQVYFPCHGTHEQRTWYARYRIHSLNGALDVRVDQVGVGTRGCNEWLSLGHYAFAAGTGGHVHVFDDTNELNTTGRRVLVDAVRFQPVTVGPFEAEEHNQGPGLRERIPRIINYVPYDWQQRTSLGGYLGSGYMEALPNSGTSINTGYTTASPELRYRVVFPAIGTYHVWLRGYGGNSNDDTIHAGLNGVGPASADRICGCNWATPGWQWSKGTLDGPPATFYVGSPGLHTFNLWMFEDGFRVDRALFTLDANYVP